MCAPSQEKTSCCPILVIHAPVTVIGPSISPFRALLSPSTLRRTSSIPDRALRRTLRARPQTRVQAACRGPRGNSYRCSPSMQCAHQQFTPGARQGDRQARGQASGVPSSSLSVLKCFLSPDHLECSPGWGRSRHTGTTPSTHLRRYKPASESHPVVVPPGALSLSKRPGRSRNAASCEWPARTAVWRMYLPPPPSFMSLSVAGFETVRTAILAAAFEDKPAWQAHLRAPPLCSDRRGMSV